MIELFGNPDVLFCICREEKGIPVDGGATSSSLVTQTTVAAAAQLSTNRASTVNPLNNQQYSQRYHTLYRKRILLPVFEYRADFMRLLAENQCIVLVGEVSLIWTLKCLHDERNGDKLDKFRI